jgi:hypothetical protein
VRKSKIFLITLLTLLRLSVVKTALKKKLKLKKGNGGWGDRRDHALCLNMTIGSSDH